MKFHIKKIILWHKDGFKESLDFAPNKVNVITGDSLTGKTSIMHIIDYCFFASKTKIPQKIINEKIEWYGIQFSINDKKLTLARKYYTDHNNPPDLYYFSGIGDIPEVPNDNYREKICKEIIEKEFSIYSNVTIPYPGYKLKKGSKISLRYFMLFNTISGDIISSTSVFFDKQYDTKYKEALERIFFLALGIFSLETISTQEQIKKLELDIQKLTNKQEKQLTELDLIQKNKEELVNKALSLGILPSSLNQDTPINDILKSLTTAINQNHNKNIHKLEQQRTLLIQKIRNLEEFKENYSRVKKIESIEKESLIPIKYINENFFKLIESNEVKNLLNHFTMELKELEANLKKPLPINIDIKNLLNKLNAELNEITEQIKYEKEYDLFYENDIEKFMFLGELRYRLQHLKNLDKDNINEFGTLIETQKKELDYLQGLLPDKENESIAIKILEEFIDNYIVQSKTALGAYGSYKSIFNIKNMTVELRPPNSIFAENTGSSNKDMFLHLCLFLALHELIILNNSPFVPSFLILDQPSRPYYNRENTNKNDLSWDEVKDSDKEKMSIALKLINDFIKHISKSYEHEFQIILLEHIPISMIQKEDLEYFHLVEEFIEGKKGLVKINPTTN
ncbi:MAG: DUF3732 domain-containing protein [Solibacillus sp.]